MRTENVRQLKMDVVEGEAECMGELRDKGRGQSDGGHGTAKKKERKHAMCRKIRHTNHNPDGEQRHNS